LGLIPGQFDLVQDPACGYKDISFDVSGLPSLVTYDPITNMFNYEQSNDKSLAGTHTVTILASVAMPLDYTMDTYMMVETEIEFIITVELCRV